MTTTERDRLQIHVRWMIRRDMTEVLEIEQEAFEFPWSDDDFTRCMRQRNCIGMVADYPGNKKPPEGGCSGRQAPAFAGPPPGCRLRRHSFGGSK